MQRVILANSLAINSTGGHFMRSIVALLSILTLFATHVHASAYNVNDAFIANESGTPTDPNGPYTYGYNFTPATPAAISTTGLVHSGVNGFNGGITPEPGVQGFYFPNNASVPAVLGNITNSTIVTNFGPTLKAGELLLHPGSPTSNGFSSPAADGDLQYTVATAGPYEISGSFEALDVGNTGISVYVNGVQAFTAADGAQGTITPFSLFESLTAGSTIAFVVSPGPGGIGNNSTGLFANIMTVPEPSSLVAFAGLCGIGLIGLVLRRRRRGAQRTALFCSLAVICVFAAANLASAGIVNVDLEGYRSSGGVIDANTPPTTFVGVGAAGGGMVFNGLSPTAFSDTSTSTTTGDRQTLFSSGGLLESNGALSRVNFTIGPVGVDNENPNLAAPTNATSLFSDYVFNNGSPGNAGVSAAFTISGLIPGSTEDIYLYSAGTIASTAITNGTQQGAIATNGIYNSGNTVEWVATADGSGDIFGTMGPGANILAGLTVAGVGVQDVPEPSSLVALAGLCGIGLVGLVLRRRGRIAKRTALFCSLAVVCFFAAGNLASAAAIVNVDLEGFRGSEAAPTTYVGSGAAGGGTVFNGLSPTAYSDGTASTSTGDNQTLSTVGGLLDSNGMLSRINFTIGPVGVDNELASSPQPTAPSLFNDYVFNNSAGNGSSVNFTISGLTPFSTDNVYLYAGYADVTHLPNTTVTGGTFTAFTATGPFNAGDTVLFVAPANSLGEIFGTMGSGTNILAGFTVAGVGVQDVPEPSSLVALAGLCGIGLVGLVWRRRRRSA